MEMNTTYLIAAIVMVCAVIAVLFMWRRRQSHHLRERFGEEYQREVGRSGSVRRAEAVLAARERRVARLHIRPLSSDDATRFAQAWRAIQTQFVDDPRGAVHEADRVVGEVMLARGYPVGDFEQQVEDISVDHPDVVMNYRAAREIAGQHARGEASTEDLRQAMIHYRALFEDLLPPEAEPSEIQQAHVRRA